MKCPKCGAFVNEAEHRFCPDCGAEVVFFGSPVDDNGNVSKIPQDNISPSGYSVSQQPPSYPTSGMGAGHPAPYPTSGMGAGQPAPYPTSGMGAGQQPVYPTSAVGDGQTIMPENISQSGDLQTVMPESSGVAPESTSKKSKTKIAIIAGCAAVVVAILLAGVFMLRSTPETPVKKYIKGLNNCDLDLVISIFPEELQEILYYDEVIKEGFVEELNNLLETNETRYGDGDFSYEIISDRYLSGAEIEELEDGINISIQTEAEYAGISVDTVEITEAHKMIVEISYRGVNGEDTEEKLMTTVKIGGKWYIWIV